MKLLVLEGPAARPIFEIFNERTLIGRAPDCDVMVFDAQVSRHHAQILKVGDAYVFESLQPANPSIVNDRVVMTTRQLMDGDLIVLGSVVLEVDIPPLTMPDPRHAADVHQAAVLVTEERRTPRPPTVLVPPHEQIKAMAARLGEVGERLQRRAATQPQTLDATATDRPIVERIVADHERLGGDQELARLAALLSERLSNQTDIRALYLLGAEAAALIAWARIAQRSMDEAVHLAQVLGVH